MTAKINYGRPKSNVKYWARKTWETLLINISNGILLIIAFYWYKFYHVCYFCAAFFGLYIVAKGFLIIKFTEISYIIRIREPITVNYTEFCFPGVLFDQKLIQIFSFMAHLKYKTFKDISKDIAYLIFLQKESLHKHQVLVGSILFFIC